MGTTKKTLTKKSSRSLPLTGTRKKLRAPYLGVMKLKEFREM